MTELCLRPATDCSLPDASLAPRRHDCPGDDHALTRIERDVVALAAAEARRGVSPAAEGGWSRLRHAVDLVLGRRSATSFADPRLDQLYRFAHAAANGAERLADVRRLRDAGFGAAQVALAARISRTAE